MAARRLRVLLAASVLAGSGATASAAPSACRLVLGPALPANVPVLSVSVSAERAAYARGSVAVLHIAVRNLVPDGPKVVHAEVSVVLSSDERTLTTLYGETDAAGEVRVPWRVGRSTPVGAVKATAQARAQVLTGYDCSGVVYEVGSAVADPAFRAR